MVGRKFIKGLIFCISRLLFLYLKRHMSKDIFDMPKIDAQNAFRVVDDLRSSTTLIKFG